MIWSVTQLGAQHQQKQVTPSQFFFFPKLITENPYQLHLEHMTPENTEYLFHFTTFVVVGKTDNFPCRPQEGYFGNKSTSYLSNALSDRTSRRKFSQMYRQGSRTTQTTCPIHTERSLHVWASREELGVTAHCR